MPAILVVEHDAELGCSLVDQLTADGYDASLARTAEHARVLARAHRPEAVILGLLDSPRGALDLLAEIRGGACSARGVFWVEDLPAIVVGSPAHHSAAHHSAAHHSAAHHLDLLRAFEAGADDFITRPVIYLELRVRLRALLRRAGSRRCGERLEVGPLRLDTRARTVTLHDHPVQLRRLEYQLLAHLAREPTRVFLRQELLQAVWGFSAPVSTRTLDSHASRLRGHLACDGHRWVVNVRGVGYRLT